MAKKEVIIYDMVAFPDGLDINTFLKLKEEGIIYWDRPNCREAVIPFEPKPANVEHTFRIVDISMLTEEEREELKGRLNIG